MALKLSLKVNALHPANWLCQLERLIGFVFALTLARLFDNTYQNKQAFLVEVSIKEAIYMYLALFFNYLLVYSPHAEVVVIHHQQANSSSALRFRSCIRAYNQRQKSPKMIA